MQKVITEYKCNICNKQYSGYQSLWIHNKKFHIQHSEENTRNSKENTRNNEETNIKKIYNCKYCNKKFSYKQSKSDHERNYCKNKNNIIEENELLKKELANMKDQMSIILNKYTKIHHKTLQKINNNLINNTNNGIINNTIVKFGNEQLSTLLTKKDMCNITNKICLCIEESIKTVHFNKKLPEYNNIFITNMRDSTAYIFDGSNFILTSKTEVINNMIASHLENIEDYLEDAEISENKYNKITNFLKHLNNENAVFIDENNNNKKYTNYKAYKLNVINQLIYNNSNSKLLKKLNSIELEEKIIDV